MQWFGESWDAPVCDPRWHVDTPVGKLCDWCQEPVDEGDSGVVMGGMTLDADGIPAPVIVVHHRNCFLRQTLGSVGHQKGTCICHGVHRDDPQHEDDPPEMTLREAADAAVELFYATAEKNGWFTEVEGTAPSP
jgi:hypothetical protein